MVTCLSLSRWSVVTAYGNELKATRHYYMNSQRVASALSYYLNSSELCEEEGPTPEEGSGGCDLGPIVDLEELLLTFGLVEGTNYDMEILQDPLAMADDLDTEVYGPLMDECEEDEACMCAIDPYMAYHLYEVDCGEYNIMYWYHPDYLGNTELITDRSGAPYQYFWYSPWGEALVEQHSAEGTYSSFFRFNGKELDEETGNYYYGARYYDPMTSVWLSVDPLAHEFPSWTPYHFVHNNPINLIDPDGRKAWEPDGEGGWIAEAGDGAETLAQDAEISREEAYKVLEEQGHGTYVDDDGVTKSAVDPGDVVQVSKPNGNGPPSEGDVGSTDDGMQYFKSRVEQMETEKQQKTEKIMEVEKDLKRWVDMWGDTPGDPSGGRKAGQGYQIMKLEVKKIKLMDDTNHLGKIIRGYNVIFNDDKYEK